MLAVATAQETQREIWQYRESYGNTERVMAIQGELWEYRESYGNTERVITASP